MDRLRRLSDDEFDRLAVAEPPPIAFLATIRRFATAEGRVELDAVEAEVAGLVPQARWAETGIREGLTGVATEITLAPFLDDTLTEPFRSRARERLLRAWDASLEQPRWGPSGDEVTAVRDRVRQLTPAEVAAFVRASAGVDARNLPWPDALDREEDEAQRISAVLAARDVAGALPTAGLTPEGAVAAGRLLGRLGHIMALRHAFPASRYAALVAPWRTATGATAPRHDGPKVRRAR